MTIEEFYNQKQNLKAPENLGFLEKRDWFRKNIKLLQDKLSKEDLKIVIERAQNWQRKLQSSHG